MIGAGDRDYENTHTTSEFDTKIDLYFSNIDKNDKNTWRTIYKAIVERYFGDAKLLPRAFIYLCKNNPNDPQKIPTDINKNKKKPHKKKSYTHRW